jgi:thiol-disulfide isomerase/thioredoxin
VAIVLAVLLAFLTVVPALAAPAAPGFRVTLLDSRRSFDSREMMGKKVVVLRFQASYCKPCARESPALARLVERYRGREVEFLALHVQDTAADVRGFVREQKVNYAVALDPKLTIGNRYSVKGTPYTVVIDRKGEIAARLTGESAVTRLPRILDEALRQGAPKK